MEVEAPFPKGVWQGPIDTTIREILDFAKCIALLTFDQMDREERCTRGVHRYRAWRARCFCTLKRYLIRYIRAEYKVHLILVAPSVYRLACELLKESFTRNYATTIRECCAFLWNPLPRVASHSPEYLPKCNSRYRSPKWGREGENGENEGRRKPGRKRERPCAKERRTRRQKYAENGTLRAPFFL